MRLALGLLLALGLVATAGAQTTPPSPSCYPDLVYPAKVRTTKLPDGASSRYTHAAAWTCATPTGYRNEMWMFSWSSVAQEVTLAAVGVFNEQAARTRCATECKALTPEELVFVTTWSTPYRAKAVVSPSGTQTSRPVYELNPDGTRQPTALIGSRVQVGVPCRLNQRVGSSTFHSVEGQPNVATPDPTDVLGPVVTICSVVTPIGLNL